MNIYKTWYENGQWICTVSKSALVLLIGVTVAHVRKCYLRLLWTSFCYLPVLKLSNGKRTNTISTRTVSVQVSNQKFHLFACLIFVVYFFLYLKSAFAQQLIQIYNKNILITLKGRNKKLCPTAVLTVQPQSNLKGAYYSPILKCPNTAWRSSAKMAKQPQVSLG